MEEKIKKIARIFISSTQCLLIEDRQTIINTVLQHGAFPIAQEYKFEASNAVLPINKCEEKVEQADAIVVVINAWYGSIIQEDGQPKKCAGCKVRDICTCAPSRDGKINPNGQCQISYTHYEYLYAKKMKKDVYVLMRECVTDNEIDSDEFSAERHRCKTECERLGKKCHETCRQNIKNTKIPEVFYDWIKKIETRMRSTYRDEKSLISAMGSIVDSIKDQCGSLESSSGLCEYAAYKKAMNFVEKNKRILLEVEDVFEDQAFAIEDAQKLAEEGVLYKRETDDDKPLIRVLCFRGNSFVNGNTKQWEPLIMSSQTKDATIEYVLANLDDKKVLKRRFDAFKNNFDNDYPRFERKYLHARDNIESILLDPDDDYDCRLFLHNESNLPFRMLFIGDILYLSFFLNNTPAERSKVYKLNKTSRLYAICEEYYDRVKEQSIEKKSGV